MVARHSRADPTGRASLRIFGLLIIAVALVPPLFGFLGLEALRKDPLAIFSQYLGAAALIVMSISQLLAARPKGIEMLFGGLDRIYVLHKWLGVGAMLLILLHDTIDADVEGIGEDSFLSDLAETLGEIALYSLLVLVTVSIATFVPYHLWRFTHKFVGAFYALGALHFMLIAKPFAVTDPLGLYVLAFCLLGILSYVFCLLPFGVLRGRVLYRVESVEDSGEALAVSLLPLGRGIKHRPGQFAFVAFDLPGLQEVHPFTISKAPGAGRGLRFSIKPAGDYSDRLKGAVKPGVLARVSGPHGHFQAGSGKAPEVWIAAGIGITPFLARAAALKATAAPVQLFYCVRRAEAAAHLDELRAIAVEKANFHLHLQESDRAGRMQPRQVTEALGGSLAGAQVSFCGPKAMREALRKALIAEGLPPGRFHFEEFEIRSGLGLRRLAAWLQKRLAAR